jgi:hypothetical protein
MEGYIKIGRLPIHERQKAAEAVEARIQSISNAHILLHVIMPALLRATIIDIRNVAQLLTARVGLAIERYRLAAGKLPDALTDLVPAYLNAVPRDPFDGNDLRYKKLEPGFVVYSIGEDLIDDDGKEMELRTRESPNWDVTFIVER